MPGHGKDSGSKKDRALLAWRHILLQEGSSWAIHDGGRAGFPGRYKRIKVYHLSDCPGFNTMSQTNISTFTSEAEAQHAGYRKAHNCP